MTTQPEKFPSLIDSHDYVYDFPDYPSRKHHEGRLDSAPAPRKRLPIPDVRPEQVYLSRIRSCLHIEPRPSSVEEKEKIGPVAPVLEDEERAAYTAATHVSPLVDSSQQITRIDWGKLSWITVRDHVIMPLLQGIVWGVVGQYYRPFISLAGSRLRGDSNPRANPVEGGGVGWLRSWVKKLGLSDITTGKTQTAGRV
ncbi:hypothetical protein BV22DRAFT_1129278 [Leucogyrophana mollusca]|uniref:Uncharacterized protein n=1 Tax=Leucogyrophana mollusca TaxID=85980 RepID=A0ACB8BH95_9AGAM|nr:hypothetical protein BV22DRAFT_1129278 [Leucogyrophana mollusca]